MFFISLSVCEGDELDPQIYLDRSSGSSKHALKGAGARNYSHGDKWTSWYSPDNNAAFVRYLIKQIRRN